MFSAGSGRPPPIVSGICLCSETGEYVDAFQAEEPRQTTKSRGAQEACRFLARNRAEAALKPVGAVVIDTDASLQAAIDAVSLPGILVGHRRIVVGDEQALTADEARAFSSSVIERQRAAGTARIVARALLERIGYARCPLPRASSGAPVWPAGVAGSLAHDRDMAVAAVATANRIAALGIDIEPAELLPADLLDIVATPAERRRIEDDPYRGRLLFVAKEAVYKAVWPLDRIFLEHHDVEIDLSGRKGTVRNGRVVELRFILSTHVIALAFIRAATDSGHEA